MFPLIDWPILVANIASISYALLQAVLMPSNQVTDTFAILLASRITLMTTALGTLQELFPSIFSINITIHYVGYVVRFFMLVTTALALDAGQMLAQGTT